jgi:DNA-binding response OmpR family regulator
VSDEESVQMIWDATRRAKIFVVDSCSQGYQSLQSASQRGVAEITFFANGRDALRANATDSPAMWIVNMHLPDMQGADLQAMLRSQGSQASIALVGDQYTVEDELTARCSGADMYFAKPLHADLGLATHYSNQI